jgi:hypothetical protein
MCKYSDDKSDNLAMYQRGCYTRNDHAEIAYRVLIKYNEPVAKIVRSHMQKWSKVREMELIWGQMIAGDCKDRDYQLGLVVAMSDYKMSKPVLDDFGKAHVRQMFESFKLYEEDRNGR